MEELQKYFVCEREIIESDQIKVGPKGNQRLIEASCNRDDGKWKDIENITSNTVHKECPKTYCIFENNQSEKKNEKLKKGKICYIIN